MMPETGQQVRCFLRFNAMVLDGRVEEWSNNQIVLRSLTDDSLMIIHCPADILLTKIMMPEQPIKEKPITEIKQEISTTLAEVLRPNQNIDLKQVKLTKLRDLVREQDQKIITDKRKEHFGIVGSSKMAIPYVEQKDLPIIKKGH